jgi:hypothetical protein
LKQIKGFPNYYISACGEIYTLNHDVWSKKVTQKNKKYGYYCVNLYRKCKAYKKYIHVLVYEAYKGPVPKSCVVDHIDRNIENNTIDNLRKANRSQNRINAVKLKQTTSKHKGVYWDKAKSRWIAVLGYKGKVHYIGSYLDECKAALAYNTLCQKLYGEFALLNKVDICQ